MRRIKGAASKSTRESYSERMVEFGAKRTDFAVFESDIGYSTFSYRFGERFPERYFNLGIAEIGTTAAAAGMACDGRTVIVSGYGVFLTMRALEAVRSFICYPNLNVKFLASHGGLTAAIDGTTHQATEDIAFMTTLPNMKVLVPCDDRSAGAAFEIALETTGPVFTRLMRDPLYNLYDESDSFALGGSVLLAEGGDLTIATYGDTVFQALSAVETLAAGRINAELIDFYSVKPFDEKRLEESVKKTGRLLVVENHQRRNGLAYAMGIHLLLKEIPCRFAQLGLSDTFGESGKYESIMEKYGLAASNIKDAAQTLMEK
jgi:transketolase